MSERLIDPSLTNVDAPTEASLQREPGLSYRERFVGALRNAGEKALGIVDTAAAISLAREDLRHARESMTELDTPYDGLIMRRNEGDTASMRLEADMQDAFTQDATALGYKETDDMSAELRTAVAEHIAGRHHEAAVEEVRQQHPDWSEEELAATAAQQTQDIAAVLTMNSAEREAYEASTLEYQRVRATTDEIQAELAEFRELQRARVGQLGRVALGGVVGFAGAVRHLPSAVSARAVVAGTKMSERYSDMSAEHKRAAGLTAAGVAVAGLASYIIAMRYGGGHGPSGTMPDVSLASSHTPAATFGTEHVATFGTDVPAQFGSDSSATFGTDSPATFGTSGPEVSTFGADAPQQPAQFGGEAPAATFGTDAPAQAEFGTDHAATFGSESHQSPAEFGTDAGIDQPEAAITSTSDLFDSKEALEKWPTVVTVDRWDSQTLDGSLSGISQQMLRRGGVSHPTHEQIYQVVSALRPQAQPNGELLAGQRLDLRPALRVIHALR